MWHSTVHLSYAYFYGGDIVNGTKYEEMSIRYEKELDHESYTGMREFLRGCKNYYSGNLPESLENFSFTQNVFQNSKQLLPLGDSYSLIGDVLYQQGELDQALEYQKKSLEIRQKYECDIHIAMAYFNIIIICTEQKKVVKANSYLDKLAKLKESNPNKRISAYHEVSQATLLRYDQKNLQKAKEIFENVIADEISIFKATEKSHLYICDILLEELKVTRNMSILKELKHLIENLSHLAERNHAFLLLVELYFLQSKLLILELNIESSLNLLEKAQKLANLKGLKRLEVLISNEHDSLLEQLDVWDSLSNRLPSLEERFMSTHIEDILNKMLTKWVNYSEVIIEEEQPAFFLVLSAEGSIIFADSFLSKSFEEEIQFADFFAKILEKSEIVKEANTVVRIKYREFMCLLSMDRNLQYCYIFLGRSFLAKNKFQHFMDCFIHSELVTYLNNLVDKRQYLDTDTRIRLTKMIEQHLI
jgi:tetratricopeptide (TPR) repeat protein